MKHNLEYKESSSILQVQMLGGFSISIDGELYLEDVGRSRKVWNLLEYLLANRENNITQDSLIDAVCNDEHSIDPANVLKNLIYRLRTLLEDKHMPSNRYIVCHRGIYSWNKTIPCEIDVDLFEKKCIEAKLEHLPRENRIAASFDAIRMYRGRFLPKSSYEKWVIPLSNYYHRLYIECVQNLFERLSEQGSYEPMIGICNQAIAIDPYDETIFELLIRSHIQLGQHKDALAAYHTITDRLYNELGVNPSEEISGLYKEIMKTIKSIEYDLSTIKQDLNEILKQEGAYFCDYEIFKNLYRFVARNIVRTGQSVFIMLYTLTDRKNNVPEVQLLGKSMDRLQGAIMKSLRKGDAFARYSNTQYIVMLPGISYENGNTVGKRIADTYGRNYHSRNVKLNFKLLPLDPPV